MLYTPWELYHITFIEIVPMVIQEHKLQPIVGEKDVGGEHQVLVAAHLNTGILYNHFIVNSVNMCSGKNSTVTFFGIQHIYYHDCFAPVRLRSPSVSPLG